MKEYIKYGLGCGFGLAAGYWIFDKVRDFVEGKLEERKTVKTKGELWDEDFK